MIFTNRRGLGLTEMIVVVALIGVLSSAVLIILSSIYSGALNTNNRLEQISRSEDLLGGVNALLSGVRPSESTLGLETAGLGTFGDRIAATPAGLLPPSLAGDQLLFTSQGTCFRLFYRAEQRDLWVAMPRVGAQLSSDCSDLTNNGALLGPNQSGPITSAVYDPVLKAVQSSSERVTVPGLVAYPLAKGIAPLDGAPIFTYRYPDFSAAATDNQALLGSSNSFYTGPDGLENREALSAIEVQFVALSAPDLPLNQQPTIPKQYRQTIYLNQSCELVQ